MEAPLIPHLHLPAVRASHVISRSSSVDLLSAVRILLCFLFFFFFQLQSHLASSCLHFSPRYSAEQSVTLSRCCLVLPFLLSGSALVICRRALKEYGRLPLLLLLVASTVHIASFLLFCHLCCQSCTFVSPHSRRRHGSAQLLTVYKAFCLEAVYSEVLLLGATTTSHATLSPSPCIISLITCKNHVGT